MNVCFFFSVADLDNEKHDVRVVVSFDGMVTWVPPVNYKSSCQVGRLERQNEQEMKIKTVTETKTEWETICKDTTTFIADSNPSPSHSRIYLPLSLVLSLLLSHRLSFGLGLLLGLSISTPVRLSLHLSVSTSLSLNLSPPAIVRTYL